MDPDIKTAFVDELKKCPLLFSKKDDELIWTNSKSGEYSVKEGYNFLSLDVKRDDLPFKLFWHAACLPKAGAFAWLVVQDRILIGMRLDRLGITVVFPCVRCGGSLESMDHLFLYCPFANHCWYWPFNKFNWRSALSKDLRSHFISWPLLYPSAFYACLWIIAPSILIWRIWLEWNNRIFKKLSSPLHDVLFCIEKLISEIVLAFIYKGSSLHNTYTPLDNWVTKNWATLKTLPLSGAISQPQPLVNRKEVVWLPPSASKVKLNFDGASRGNPAKSAIRIAVSDDRAGIIKAQCQCIAYGTNNVVELHDLSTSLDLLLSLHLLDVVIQGNSQLELFNSFTMVHCFREANKVVDFLANKASDEDIQDLVEVASSSLPPHLV
ncbi:uncharacterized protein LOC131875943 [Cryptomeria japonica]|uniref:uncharacterized protein LOC131875943 n=1 Tax=Cryptomeria japonica TaxID=3369 RepID=UPI0027DA3F9F|nr:uncharacterized protein LOC131875943 [Cryptomeria japonica]